MSTVKTSNHKKEVCAVANLASDYPTKRNAHVVNMLINVDRSLMQGIIKVETHSNIENYLVSIVRPVLKKNFDFVTGEAAIPEVFAYRVFREMVKHINLPQFC